MTAIKSWRAPTAEEFPHGIAALAKLIGEVEAVAPGWTRRLVRAEPDGQWCLTIDQGGKPTWDHAAPYADPPQLAVTTLVYPLGEGVEILRGPNNPEEILRQRREACRVHDEDEAAIRAAAAAERAQHENNSRQAMEDKRRFNHDGWAKLDPWQQALYAVAVRVQARDPALASDLRAVAAEGRGAKPAQPHFPFAEWEHERLG
jgi:hypothetical protein